MVVIRANGSVLDIPLGGAPLGIMPNLEFPDHEITLEPGDVCAVYSDGITEQRNAAGEMYERDRFVHTVRELRTHTAADVVARVRESVQAFAGDCPADDDFTLVALRRTDAA
jgi:sigma-B regulation protein RsbU (phosphoserine phosphatase)